MVNTQNNAISRFFKSLTIFDRLVFLVGISLLVVMRLVFDARILSIISVLFSLTGGICNAKRLRIHSLLSITSAIIYIYICYDARLFGESILYLLVIVPIYINGFIKWEKEVVLKVIEHIKKREVIVVLVVGVLFIVSYGSVLKYFLNANQPFVTALSSYSCAVAVYMTSKRYYEQWYLWLFGNLILIYIWTKAIIVDQNTSGYSLLVQNMIFIAININGWISWRKLKKLHEINSKLEND